MKKVLLFFLTLMLGCSLAGAQNTRVLGSALLSGKGCPQSYGIKVKITKGDSTLQKETDYGEDYAELIGCMYGYEFMAWEAGVYGLTYSKDGYETKTQQITVEAGAERFIVPSVTLEPQTNDYTFGGNLRYTTADEETKTVADAQILCYKDAQGTEKLGETRTDAEGNWQITVQAQADASVYFDAVHPNIEVLSKTSAAANSTTKVIPVQIYCSEKTPDLLGMETYKLRQAGTIDEPWVELSWTWPQELLDNYRIAGNKGVYQVSRVQIFRDLGAAGWSEIGSLEVADSVLPGTSFVDGKNAAHRLLAGKTYQYRFEITYKYPKSGVVTVNNDSRLTITLGTVIPQYDSVTLTLAPNNPEWGTVTGAGKYEENDEVVIRAQANRGYVFSAWKNGEETIATTAKHKLVITENMTLTAVFEEKAPVYDSVRLTLEANNAAWGTIEGAGRYARGEEVTVKATPNKGYLFKEWKAGSVVLSNKAEYTLVLATDSTLTAVFEYQTEYRGMTNCKARQIDATTNRITWRWPQELLDEYVTADGEGTYEIFRINVFRLDPGETSYAEVGSVRPESGDLPGTFFVDSSSNHPLVLNNTYTYRLEVVYSKPQQQSVFVEDEARLTVRMVENPVVEPDTVLLTLRVNDKDMGTVQGAGEYEEGSYVTIKAIPNAGYEFVAWMNRTDTVAKTAEHKFVLDADLTLTALFKKQDGGTSNEDREQSAWRVWSENGAMVLRSNAACRYDVYNMAGVLVKQAKVNQGEYRIALNSGLYIIRRISATGYSVKKAVVR
ncbi:MAG: InlB B-repeat-containing protein [Bacteroidales bacterium]|nr:InlB B-repeat-containing protein [Bacteroidales bacterium]